ncbi:hypothetical protein Tco_0875870 [Tanacetum coccineum]|uniref:Uncharacterized protein n=1 Tax=Tanacetum coccineum TaxID=301880 RepID=A0ABQ5BSD3_9ASTR
MKSVDDEPAHNWLNDLANTEKPPLFLDDLMSTPIDFSAFSMNRLKINKLKADLVGPVYNLLKGTCKSCVELEYNMLECYRTLSDQLDWNNPKGNCCPYDLSKPLPLHEFQGRLTITADFFFNNDLEYLRGGSTDKNTKARKVQPDKTPQDPKVVHNFQVLSDPDKREAYEKNRKAGVQELSPLILGISIMGRMEICITYSLSRVRFYSLQHSVYQVL